MNSKEALNIEDLLDKLDANFNLRKNVFDILNYHTATLEIYANTVINGLSIALELKNGSRNIVFISPMQSGKSGSVFFLNYILTEVGVLKPNQNILFLTSMRDIDLYEQNVLNMQKQYFDCVIQNYRESKIFVEKIDEIFKYPNPYEVVRERNIGLFIRDEDQYGAGMRSTFDWGFMRDLRRFLPEMPLLSISATPFDILDSINKGYPVKIVNGLVPDNYIGVSKMIELGLIENIDDEFSPYVCKKGRRGRLIYEISGKFDEYMNHLISFEDGVGIIRVSKTEEAFILRKIARNKYNNVKTLVIGSDSGCDYSISEGMNQIKILVNTQRKRVLLIVVNALSAGKDFKSLKEKIRFGIETRRSQLANGAQGIPGRICGYHKNRTFKLLASMPLLNKYREFENNSNVINDQDWRNELIGFGVRGLSTHVKLIQTRKQSDIIPIVNLPIKVSYEELQTVNGRNILFFLNDETFNNLLGAFHYDIWYEENKFRLNEKNANTTIRVASNYKADDNRVYKLWNKYSIGEDFRNVILTRKFYKWGILISNIPIGLNSKSGIENYINFRGIEIYEAGNKITQRSHTISDNHSMYIK